MMFTSLLVLLCDLKWITTQNWAFSYGSSFYALIDVVIQSQVLCIFPLNCFTVSCRWCSCSRLVGLIHKLWVKFICVTAIFVFFLSVCISPLYPSKVILVYCFIELLRVLPFLFALSGIIQQYIGILTLENPLHLHLHLHLQLSATLTGVEV